MAEKKRQKAVSDALKDKPLPGAVAVRPLQKVNKTLYNALRGRTKKKSK